jgi:hypothetical protein
VQLERGAMPRIGPAKLKALLADRKTLEREFIYIQDFVRTIGESLQSRDTNALKHTFAIFDMDAADLYDRNGLLKIFAEAHFGEPAARGRSKEWDIARILQLASDYAAMKREHPRLKTKEQVCAKILEVFPQRYSSLNATTLVRRLNGNNRRK